jgi:tRNA (guanosine-2'-O-)-methyltransferase
VPSAKTALEELDALVPAAFLVGNEHSGLTNRARELCDGEFAIPLHGFSQSVNLSVATAVTVYTHARRRRQALGRDGDLEGAELLTLRADYYRRSVDARAGAGAAKAIVERWRQEKRK